MRDVAGKNAPSVEELERLVEELENIADALAHAPDDEVVESLERAIQLLSEVNAGIETSLRSSGEETARLGTLLESVNFYAFDEVLSELEDRERAAGEPGR